MDYNENNMSKKILDKAFADFVEQFEAFLLSPLPNSWLKGSFGEVYVRVRSFRALDAIKEEKKPRGKMLVSTIDVANINLKIKGKGLGTRILKYVHAHNPREATYIENVLEPTFGEYLIRHGWHVVVDQDPRYIGPRSYLKWVSR